MRAPYFAVAFFTLTSVALAADYRVGVAQVDITPDYPIRLSGFGFRRTESEGVTHRIWAKAIAVDCGDAPTAPAVIVGVPINRRTKGGPVDHDLPVLAVRNPDGSLRAVYLSYACHCVTLSNNKISGDWAGFVDDAVQKNHPGVVVLTSVACGADSNPD